MVEHVREVALLIGGVALGPVGISGRRLNADAAVITLDFKGQLFTVRKGENEAPAQRVEVITGRFNEDS